MSANPWLAIDADTAPTLRAQELRFAWERFVSDLLEGAESASEEGGELVREPIADSWRRSFAAGVDPTGTRLAPVVADEGETHERWAEHPLAAAAPMIDECLAATADQAACLVVVSDASGMLLSIEGSPGVRMKAADSMNFAEGTLWSEPGAGTNAIGTALAVDHAVQVFGPEHFHEVVQRWTCSAAPIHDPDTGALLGVIDLTGDYSTVHPHSLALAATTAQAIEASLRALLRDEDARLVARLGAQLAARPGLGALVLPSGRVLTPMPPAWGAAGRLAIPAGGGELVLPSGLAAIAESIGHGGEAFLVRAVGHRSARDARPLLRLSLLGTDRPACTIGDRRIELRQRLAEILALLCAHPGGLGAEALCAHLHGDDGTAAAVRVEVSRLRKLLGGWIDTDRYRLTCDVESDVRLIEGLLRAGAVREAAERYPGPLLPGSDAPGIVDERERLEAWLHQAVMTSDDVETLWAWVNSPSGGDDLSAWKRLLAGVDFRDARRSLAASRVTQLRRAALV
jgi:hypothetical protein